MFRRYLALPAILSILILACGEEDDSVTPSNSAPVLSQINEVTVSAGELLQVGISAIDADGDQMTFSLSGNPGFISITGTTQPNDTAFATMNFEPSITDTGNYTVRLIVEDDQGNSSREDFITVVEGQEISTYLPDYFPLHAGCSWEYRVTFDDHVYVPYSPWFEYPDGFISSSFTHGWGSWDQGEMSFSITANSLYEVSNGDSTWDLQLDENAMMLFFYNSSFDSCRFQYMLDDDELSVNLIAVMSMDPPRWRIARRFAKVRSENLENTQAITVPAGEFNCVESEVVMYGDGLYVSSGEYPTVIYLAPEAGIVKAMAYDKSDNLLFTVELTEYSSGD